MNYERIKKLAQGLYYQEAKLKMNHKTTFEIILLVGGV